MEKNLDNHQTGIESCGYNRRYDKGINLLRVGWGYTPLTPEEFHLHADLIRKEKGDMDEEIREMEMSQLKLSKKRSDYEQVESERCDSKKFSTIMNE